MITEEKIKYSIEYILLVIFLYIACSAPKITKQVDLPRVNLRTTLGQIIIEVDTIKAPVTANNFLKYVL